MAVGAAAAGSGGVYLLSASFSALPGAKVSFDGNGWKQVGKLPRGLASGASFAVPGGVLVVGGEDSEGKPRNEVFLLKWDGSIRRSRTDAGSDAAECLTFRSVRSNLSCPPERMWATTTEAEMSFGEQIGSEHLVVDARFGNAEAQ